MDAFINILQIIVPSLAIMVVTFFLVRSFLNNNEKMRKTEYMIRSHEITVPLRLQAYERLTLFLERISIDSLLMRCNQPGMNSRQLHSELLTSIRNEYEHNLSQQVYMSVQTWEMIKNARAQMIKVINTAAEKTNPVLPAIELSKNILEVIGEYPKSPTQTALDFIKTEIQQLF
jgi:hypothetical protein